MKCSALNVDFNDVRLDPLGSRSFPYERIKFGYPLENVRFLMLSTRNRTFSRGYPNLMCSYKGLLEPSGSKLALLQSTFNVENSICRLSLSISSDFDAVQS